MKLLRMGVPKPKEINHKHNRGREIYLFISENGKFSAYITDRSGTRWWKVTRWTLLGYADNGHQEIGSLRLRPFSISDVEYGKTGELRYVLANILYDRKPIGNKGVLRALCSSFNQKSCGSLEISDPDIPIESMLANAFVLREAAGERSVSPLSRQQAEDIIAILSGKRV